MSDQREPPPGREVRRRLVEARVIAVVELAQADRVGAVAGALVRYGFTCLELRSPTAPQLRAARRVGGLTVGAGELRTVADVERAVTGRAHYGSSPVTNMEVVHACHEFGLPFLPGVATPSEVERVAAVGVKTMRVVAATPLGGPACLALLSESFPEIAFVPEGAIAADAMRDYLALPEVLAVAVSGLVGQGSTCGDAMIGLWSLVAGLRRPAASRTSVARRALGISRN